MQETITVDGKQFMLMTDVPLTAEQKIHTITEIRRQDSKIANVGGAIHTLNSVCISIIMSAPAIITLADITVKDAAGGTVSCTINSECSVTCTSTQCSGDTRDIIATFSNSGDIDGSVTPTLTVGAGTPIPASVPTIAVPASTDGGTTLGTMTAMFTGVGLTRGANNVCINW